MTLKKAWQKCNTIEINKNNPFEFVIMFFMMPFYFLGLWLFVDEFNKK